MTEYDLVESRNQLAYLARAWRIELKAAEWTPAAIRRAWYGSKKLIEGIHQLAGRHGHEVTTEIGRSE